MKKEKVSNLKTANFLLLVLLAAILIFNQVQLSTITGSSTGINLVSASVIPTGTPEIYGNELGISYDDVSPNNPALADATIEKMSIRDRTVELQGADLERYIQIVSQISCEYCCGAESIIFSDGQAACGCAHSYAMRGIAKYLIT